jgi:y4mF family transcriptional regulator
MFASNPSDLGRIVRGARRKRRMSQTQLCAESGVSRRWLSDFEAGKPTAELGLVFKVLHALGLAMEVSPAPALEFDLDEIIEAYGRRGGR